jgi:sec-independent protein translocase protein TatA
MLAFIGGSEIIFIVLIVLLLFGTKGVAGLAKTVGQGMSEFKKVSDDLKNEMSKVENIVKTAETDTSIHKSSMPPENSDNQQKKEEKDSSK